MKMLDFQHFPLLLKGAFGRNQLMEVKSCDINPYVEMMYTEYKDWSFDENAAENRGQWHSKVYKVSGGTPLDLEIGTGNGTHFAFITEKHPERMYLGLELKYKTLVQSIRRSLRAGCTNGRMARFRAEGVCDLFADEEINNVYIHFPDPWPKLRHHKNRLIQPRFLKDLYRVMKPGGWVEFKTDNEDYFHWAVQRFNRSPFTILFYSEDLHKSHRRKKNFVTHFETLFLKKQQPIYYCLLKKN